MSAPEEWRVVPGFDGWYEVSNVGAVRSWRTPAKLNVRRESPRALVGGRDGKGYWCVKLTHPVLGKLIVFVHQLVLAAFEGPRGPGMICDHRNADRGDNAVGNLRWVTATENVRHAARSGRMGPWAHSRLNPDRVREIRRQRADGVSLRTLADRFGVSASSISRVALGRGWREVA